MNGDNVLLFPPRRDGQASPPDLHVLLQEARAANDAADAAEPEFVEPTIVIVMRDHSDAIRNAMLAAAWLAVMIFAFQLGRML